MLKLVHRSINEDVETFKITDYLRENKLFIKFVEKNPQSVTLADIKRYMEFVAERYPQKLKRVIPALSYFYSNMPGDI